MIKLFLLFSLLGLLVTPSYTFKFATTVSFFKDINENYQLFDRAKAAAGKNKDLFNKMP